MSITADTSDQQIPYWNVNGDQEIVIVRGVNPINRYHSGM